MTLRDGWTRTRRKAPYRSAPSPSAPSPYRRQRSGAPAGPHRGRRSDAAAAQSTSFDQRDSGAAERAVEHLAKRLRRIGDVAADEDAPRHAVGPADEHRVRVLDRAGVPPRAIRPHDDAEAVAPFRRLGVLDVEAPCASTPTTPATAGAILEWPGRASRGCAPCPTGWRPRRRHRRATACRCAAAPDSWTTSSGLGSTVATRRMPVIPSGCISSCVDRRLVRPARDVGDEQPEQAVVEVAVVVVESPECRANERASPKAAAASHDVKRSPKNSSR